MHRSSANKALQSASCILLAVLVALIFARSPGTSDFNYWRLWTRNALIHGLVNGYSANNDYYPPLAAVFLFGASKLSDRPDIDPFGPIKLAIFVFLLLSAVVTWLWTRDLKITLILYFALLLDSVALGYIDIFFAPFLLLSLWMLQERRLLWFSVFFTLSFLTKWQPIILAPFVGLYALNMGRVLYWRRIELKRFFSRVILPAVALIGLIIIIFGYRPVERAFKLSLTDPYLSGNALNLNWIITYFMHVGQPARYGGLQNGIASLVTDAPDVLTIVPRLLFYGFYGISIVLLFRREKTFENLLIFATLGVLSYYTFNVGVHENHLFLATILASLMFWLDVRFRIMSVILMLISNINMFLFYGVDGTLHFPRTVGGLDMALPLATFNVFFFFYFLWFAVVQSRSTERLEPSPES
jgi:Gpi18-like mannosyltransferase